MSRYLAKNLQSRQKDWNEATQARLALTTSALSSIKGMKMLGFDKNTKSLLHDLRKQELAKARKVRWMMVAFNASGVSSPLFITFESLPNYYSKRIGNLLASHYLRFVCNHRQPEGRVS